VVDGIRLSLGSAENLIHGNEIMIHGPDSKYAIYFYQGSDTPMEGSDGRPRANQFFDNSIISDDEVVKMVNSDDNVFEVCFVRILCASGVVIQCVSCVVAQFPSFPSRLCRVAAALLQPGCPL